MKWIRTPKVIWNSLSKEFNFTVDACASDKNHLVSKYWTRENSALKNNWDGEVVYCHPMYDINIPKFIKKAINSKCLSVFLLPASTNAAIFTIIYIKNPMLMLDFYLEIHQELVIKCFLMIMKNQNVVILDL